MKKTRVSVTAENEDEVVLIIPQESDDREMDPSEHFLIACFAVWIAANYGDDRAKAVRDAILTLAGALVDGPSVH